MGKYDDLYRLTSGSLRDVDEELSKVDGAIRLVEALVNGLVPLLIQLAKHGGQREMARRISNSFANF